MKHMNRAPFILTYPADNAGCGHHRIIRPLELLNKAGLVNGRIDMQHFDDATMAAINPDVIVLQRQHTEAQQDAIKRYRVICPNAFLVYEIDDALSAVPDKSVHKPHMILDIDEQLSSAARLCDVITVTTKALAEHMRKICGDDMEIRVVPNMLGRDDFQAAANVRQQNTLPPGKPRVGWGGSASHGGDLALIKEVVKRTHHKYQWVFLGMHPEADSPIEFHQNFDPKTYTEALAKMQLDLVVAPLEENLFNRCKSNLRLIECGACFYPVIASAVEPYVEGKPPVVGYAKDTPESWIKAIDEFFALPISKQKQHGKKLHDWAEKNFCLDDKAVERLQYWLPKNVKPFVPFRKETDSNLILVTPVPAAYPNYEATTSLADALETNKDILWVRETTVISPEQIDRMLKRSVETQAATVNALSNASGLASFPSKEQFVGCDAFLNQFFDETAQSLPASDVDLIHPCGPAILLSRRALNFCGHPNLDENDDDETAIVEWGLMTNFRGFRNKAATDVYVRTEKTFVPTNVEFLGKRVQYRWPLNNANPDPLAPLRAQFELEFYKKQFKGMIIKDPTNYKDWATTFDTLTKRDQEALAARPPTINFEVLGDAIIEPQTHQGDGVADWLIFVRDRATLRTHALSMFEEAIKENPDAYLIYADHDTLNNGLREAHDFKPHTFDLEMLLCRDYVTPIFALRRDVATAEAIKQASNETALYGEILSIIDHHGTRNVKHVPKLLAHLPPISNTRMFGMVKLKAAHADAAAKKLGWNAKVVQNMQYPGVAQIFYGHQPFDQPKVTIIIPCFNRVDMLQPCVDSIFHFTKYKNFEVFIVDGGSTNPKMIDYQESIKSNPKVTIVTRDQNVFPFNWATLNNWAVTQTDGEYILFLNDDTRIMTPDWLTPLVAASMISGVGSVGPKLMYPFNHVQHVGVACGYGLTGHLHRMVPDGNPGYNGYCATTHQATALTGACLMTSRALFNEIGGFDERMRYNFNDVGYGIDLFKKGYRNVLVGCSVVQHIEGVTRPNTIDAAGAETMQREAAVLREHWAGCDPYWNTNLRFQHNPEGTMVSGMDFNLLNTRFETSWRDQHWTSHRLLVLGDNDTINKSIAASGDTPFMAIVQDNMLRVIEPPMQNIPPVDLCIPSDLVHFVEALDLHKIVVRSLDGLTPEVLGVLTTLDIPIVYAPKNAEAVCPRQDFTVRGVDCGKGWSKPGACQACVNKNGSPFGVVSMVGWHDAWARFLSKVEIDDADLNVLARTALHIYVQDPTT